MHTRNLRKIISTGQPLHHLLMMERTLVPLLKEISFVVALRRHRPTRTQLCLRLLFATKCPREYTDYRDRDGDHHRSIEKVGLCLL